MYVVSNNILYYNKVYNNRKGELIYLTKLQSVMIIGNIENAFRTFGALSQGKLQNLKIHDFRSGFSLLDAIEHGENFDIVILDIIMPGEMAWRLPKRFER